MKKIILTVCFTLSFFLGFSQVVVDDGFENATCGNVPPNYSPFYDGCLNGWISTHGSPGINQGSVTPYEGNNYAYMYVEYAGFSCTSDPYRGEGIALNYNFQQGFTYEISYAIRGQNNPPPFATYERNWVLTNGLANNTGGSNGCPAGEVIPATPSGSQFLPTPSYNNNSWTVNTQTFTPGANYSQLWFRARNTHTTINASVFSQMYLDDIEIKIVSQPCVPDPVTITADGTDITNTLTYTLECDNCFNLNATNITNATYNTTSNGVLTDLNGLFCVLDPSVTTSFTATITGTDSCGDPYSQNVTIIVDDTDCCTDELEIVPFCGDPCEVDGPFPIVVQDQNGQNITSSSGATFQWTNTTTGATSTSDVVLAQELEEWKLVITLANGCVYELDYQLICGGDDCNVTAPTNLQTNGASLSWDPVPGAVGYIISSPSKIKIDCCDIGVSIAPIQTTSTTYLLPVSLQERCFVWQVTAICADGSLSPVSQQACHLATRSEGKEKEKVSIYPNPSNGQMNIKLELEKDAKVELKIYASDGPLVKTIKNLESKDGVINMDLQSNLPQGLYIFRFNTGKSVITKRIVIE